ELIATAAVGLRLRTAAHQRKHRHVGVALRHKTHARARERFTGFGDLARQRDAHGRDELDLRLAAFGHGRIDPAFVLARVRHAGHAHAEAAATELAVLSAVALRPEAVRPDRQVREGALPLLVGDEA